MTDRSEHRPPEQDPGRQLSREEQKFYGVDRDRGIDRDREAREGMRREEDASFEAGAAAPAPPREQRPAPEDREPDRERGRGDSEASPRHRPDEPHDMKNNLTASDESAHLFASDEAESLRSRWDGIQARFVDEPRDAVEKADALVGDVMQRLSDGFGAERSRLEREWDRGDRVSTEDLRVALKRYRSFFDRLLSV